MQELGVRADIAGEQDSGRMRGLVSPYFNLDRGGPKKVAGVPVTGADVRRDRKPFPVDHRSELGEARFGVLGRVDWLDGRFGAPSVAAVQVLDFELLDVP